MRISIKRFCEKYGACSEGVEWAEKNCKTMMDVWWNAPHDYLLWVATRKGVLTDKQLRLFAVWCVRQVQHLLKDKRSIEALDVAERYANGKATDEELKFARDAARAAAWNARAAAGAAAWNARAAAWAAMDAAWAARATAWAAWAARAAARADSATARAAAWDAQDNYLRTQIECPFK